MTVAEAAFKAVAIQQGHEELEIFLFAVVRRGRHQQEMPCQGRKYLAEFIPFRVLDLAAEDGRSDFVRFIADDQIPAAVWHLEFLLYIFIAGEFIQPGNHQIILKEPVTGSGSFEFIIRENLKGQMEAPVEFILLLFGQAARADDQAALQVATGDQFLDQ